MSDTKLFILIIGMVCVYILLFAKVAGQSKYHADSTIYIVSNECEMDYETTAIVTSTTTTTVVDEKESKKKDEKIKKNDIEQKEKQQYYESIIWQIEQKHGDNIPARDKDVYDDIKGEIK